MTDRWMDGWMDRQTDGKLMWLLHSLTKRGSHDGGVNNNSITKVWG